MAHPGGVETSDASEDEGSGRARAPAVARGDDDSSSVEEGPPPPKKRDRPPKKCPFVETESKEDRRGVVHRVVVSDDEADEDATSNVDSASDGLGRDDDDDGAQEDEGEGEPDIEDGEEADDGDDDNEDTASYDEAAELAKALQATAPADDDGAATESPDEEGGGERGEPSGPSASAKRRSSASAPRRSTAQTAVLDALERCDLPDSDELRESIRNCALMAAAEVLAYLTSGAEATDHRTRVPRRVCRANVLQVTLIGVIERLVRRARTKTTNVLAEYGVSQLYGLARAWGWTESWLEQFGDASDLANEMRRQWAVALDLAFSEVLLRFDGFRGASDHESAVAERLRASNLPSLVRRADAEGITLQASSYEGAICEYATVLAQPLVASALSVVTAELDAAASAAQRWVWQDEEHPSSLMRAHQDNVYELDLGVELPPSDFATTYTAALARARSRGEDYGPLGMFGQPVLLHRAAVGYKPDSAPHPMRWLLGVVKWALGRQVAIRLHDGNCVHSTLEDAAAVVSLTAERLKYSGQSATELWALACRFAFDRGTAQGEPARNPVARLFDAAADTDMSTSSTPVKPAAPLPDTPPAARAPAAHVAPPEEQRAAPSPASVSTPSRAVREPAARVERMVREASGVAAVDGPQTRSDRGGTRDYSPVRSGRESTPMGTLDGRRHLSDAGAAYLEAAVRRRPAFDGKATRVFEDADGEKVDFDSDVVHQEEPRTIVGSPPTANTAPNPPGSAGPCSRNPAATGTQGGHRTLAGASAALLEADGRRTSLGRAPADAHTVAPPSAPATVKTEPAKVKTEPLAPPQNDRLGRMVYSPPVVAQLLAHTANRTLGNPAFDDLHRMVLLVDPGYGYESWQSRNGSVPGVKLGVGFENINTGELVTVVCLAPAMIARAADMDRVDPTRDGPSFALTRSGDADESIEYGPGCANLTMANFRVTITEPVARSPDQTLRAGWARFVATVDGINRGCQDWLAGVDTSTPAAARVLPNAQKVAKRNEDSQLVEFAEQQEYRRFSEYLVAVTDKNDPVAMSKVSPFEHDAASGEPLMVTATSRVRKAVINGVKAAPPPLDCVNPLWTAMSKSSVNGMRFAYKPPPVTFFDGTGLEVATADHFTSDYEFLEEGSEVLVEARLQFLVKPNRYVIQFVLESVCVLPTPPVRPTTARPTAVGAGSRAGATARRGTTSLFASVDLTGATQSTSGRHALCWLHTPCDHTHTHTRTHTRTDEHTHAHTRARIPFGQLCVGTKKAPERVECQSMPFQPRAPTRCSQVAETSAKTRRRRRARRPPGNGAGSHWVNR